MMRKANIYMTLLLSLCTHALLAQSIERQVLGSTGATLSNASTTMSFTVGEITITSIDNGSVFFSQGFHQGHLFLPFISFIYDNAWTPSDPSGQSTSTSNIEIVSGNTFISANTIANSIVIRAGAGLSVNSSVVLESVSGMRLESNSTTYASLISDGSVLGPITYKRHVNQTATIGGNDLVSPPVSGQSFTDFIAENNNLVSNTDNTLYLFGPFDKASGEYVTYGNTETALLNAGAGYRAATTDNSTLNFQGTINQETVNQAVLNSGPFYSEWNLIGNPYPSYLNVQEFLNNTNNINALDAVNVGIYGYDGDASDGWVIYNLNTIDANTNLAPGQGFFVAVDSNASIAFTPSMRRHDSTDDFIAGRNSGTNQNLRLQLNTNTKSYTTDLYFNNNSSNGLDVGYDAAVFGGNANSFALYSQLVEDNQGFDIAIQSLSSEFLSQVNSIPLGVNANQGEQLTITIENSSLSEGINVYLEDVIENTFTLLNTNDYVFSAATDLEGIGRFYIHFDNTTLSNPEIGANVLEIYTIKDQKEIVVKGQLQDRSKAELFDINGRKILSLMLNTDKNYNTIATNGLAHGVYILKIFSNTYTQVKKVMIN